MRGTVQPSQFTMANLAQRLLRQTKNAKIPWQAVDEDGNKLIYSTCKSSVIIETCGVEEETNTKVRLALLNFQGTTVESLDNERKSDESDETIEPTLNDVLDELYARAHDAALSATETFRDIFSSLDDE